jgi:hypothetical protein
MLKPAEVAIFEFKGVRALARAISDKPTNISKWRRKGGDIPLRKLRLILKVAATLGINFTEKDGIWGRSAKEQVAS